MQQSSDIVDPATLKDKKVGVSAGTTDEMWARRNLPAPEIKAYDGGGFVFNDLVNGRIHAIVDPFFNGYEMKMANKLPIKSVGDGCKRGCFCRHLSVGCTVMSISMPV